VAASFLVCLPPLAAALQAGFVDAPRDLTDILRATGTDPARLLWRIQLPSSLPFLSAGLKRSVPLALAAATVAEFVASNSGLGSRMLFAASRTETTPFFASLAVLVLLASVAEGLLLLLEHGLIVWLGPKAAWRDWGRRPAEDDFSREDDL
jgi:NitT/TauT family transport system permease protein